MLKFIKYQALGNDFLLIDRLAGGDELAAATARALCDRHRGVGADGVLTLWSDASADARMQLQNADGSESLMSGNGLRCCARYLHDAGVVGGSRDDVTVRAGTSTYACRRTSADTYRITIGRASDMHPDLPGPDMVKNGIQVGGRLFQVTCLFLGNPHAVIFTTESPLDLARAYGAALETNGLFRNRTNVTFARATNDGFEAVVHERGVGITQACGSGASALGAAAVQTELWQPGRPMNVRLPGGTLVVTVETDGTLVLEGEASRVFVGEVDA